MIAIKSTGQMLIKLNYLKLETATLLNVFFFLLLTFHFLCFTFIYFRSLLEITVIVIFRETIKGFFFLGLSGEIFHNINN